MAKEKKRSNPLLIILGVIILCCLGSIVLIAIMRLLAPRTSAPQTPRATATVSVSTGATIEFINPTNTPEVTQEVGTENSRSNPYPIGTKVNIGRDMLLQVVFVTRPANEIVSQGNIFNSTPEPNREYILVDVRVECTKDANEKCNFSTSEIKTVGTNGQVNDQAFVAGIPNELEGFNEFFGGGYIEGSVVFLVTKDDPGVVLFYEPLIFGNPGSYISLVE